MTLVENAYASIRKSILENREKGKINKRQQVSILEESDFSMDALYKKHFVPIQKHKYSQETLRGTPFEGKEIDSEI